MVGILSWATKDFYKVHHHITIQNMAWVYLFYYNIYFNMYFCYEYSYRYIYFKEKFFADYLGSMHVLEFNKNKFH